MTEDEKIIVFLLWALTQLNGWLEHQIATGPKPKLLH
jgi:hypothetical protein